MADPANLFADACEKFRRSISDDDARKFASTSLKDVRVAIQDIENSQRKRQSVQNLRRIQPLLEGLEKYAKVIEVLSNGTPYLPYVWAPIKLMLQLASGYRDIFETLLTAYKEIGDALPRFDRYEKAFKENSEFQAVVAAVYCGILDFHQRAYKFFRRRAWHVLFLSLWKDFGSRFAGIIDSLKKQRDFIDREAASIDIVEARETRAKAHHEILQRQKHDLIMLEQIEKSTRIAQFQHSVAWLSIDDKEQENDFERNSNRRHDKTCEWIIKAPRMEAWMTDNTKHPLMWLSGKPGAGKSVMCSYIIQVLSEKPDLDTCYYFCHSHDRGSISHQILRSVALQLLRRHIDLASLISNDFVYRGQRCGMSQLRTLIPKLLEILPCTRIIIDGVDECSLENQRMVLKDIQSVCFGPETRCKILISSRRDVGIYEKLSSKPQILLDEQEEVGIDIQSYVNCRIRQLRTSDEKLLARIGSLLVEKADGMFLWVRLIVEELQYCYSDAALEERVLSLPKGLHKAYGRILERIMDNDSDYARSMTIRILEFMACSYRTMKFYELLDGVVFHSRCTELNDRTKLKKGILDLCRPLIENGPANTVDFVHFSAKEYILKTSCRDRDPFISVEDANFAISFASVAYLNSSSCLIYTDGTAENLAPLVIQGFHGLHIYASQFWFKHLLDYYKLRISRNVPPPKDLVDQLEMLLTFQKAEGPQISDNSQLSVSKQIADITVLDELPLVKAFVSKIISFRHSLNRDELHDKTPDDISFLSCAADPTLFSTARHYYQLTLESLLSDEAPRLFPDLTASVLDGFRAVYGPAGYVCRYIHCSRATDGFNSARQRNAHEATHQRKFRCADPKCVYFSRGFATRAALNKHNDNYHPLIKDDKSLASTIATQKQQKHNDKYNPIGKDDNYLANEIVRQEQQNIVRNRLTDAPVYPFICAETDCDWHQIGFETEDDLNTHAKQKHIRLQFDSPKYTIEHPADLIDLSSQGARSKDMNMQNPPPTKTPSTPANQGTNPVANMILNRARTDSGLKDLIKLVAKGEASGDQLVFFQKYIDDREVSVDLRPQAAKANNQQTKRTLPLSERKQASPHEVAAAAMEIYYKQTTKPQGIEHEATKETVARPDDSNSTSDARSLSKVYSSESYMGLSETEEKLAKTEKKVQVLSLRVKLQKGLLNRHREPKEEEMDQISKIVSKLEDNMADIEAVIIRGTKITKVLRYILKLAKIPRDEEFDIKKRCKALLEKCNKILADEDITSVFSHSSGGLPPSPGERRAIEGYDEPVFRTGYKGSEAGIGRPWDKLRFAGDTQARPESSLGYTSDEEEIAQQSDEQHSEERSRARSVSSIGYTDKEEETLIPYPGSDRRLHVAAEESYVKSIRGMSPTNDREQAAVTPKPSKPNQSMDIDAPVWDAQFRTADGDDSREPPVITAELVEVLRDRHFDLGIDFKNYPWGSKCLHYDCVSYACFMSGDDLLGHFGNNHPSVKRDGLMRPTGYNRDDGKWSRFLCPMTHCDRHHLLIPVRIPVMENEVDSQLAKWHPELDLQDRSTHISLFFSQLRSGKAVQAGTLKDIEYKQQTWSDYDIDIPCPEAGISMLFLCPDCDKETEPLVITNTMEGLRLGLGIHIKERHRLKTDFVSYSAILNLVKRGSFKSDYHFKRNEILHIPP